MSDSPTGCVLRLDATAISLDEIGEHARGSGAIRPLLVTGLTSNFEGEGSAAAYVADARRLSRSSMANGMVSTGDSPSLSKFGDADGDGPLKPLHSFLEQVVLSKSSQFDDDPYIYDQGGFLQTESTSQAFVELLDTDRADAVFGAGDGRHVFSLGTRATGLNWHSHQSSWFELLVGEKRWFTSVPGNVSVHVDVTLPVASWVKGELGGDPLGKPPEGVCAFTQRPGEIVFMPGLTHATYNLAACTRSAILTHTDAFLSMPEPSV